MDKTVAGVLTTMTALALSQAQASPAALPSMEAAMQASSYSDLLKPIPNALTLLQMQPAAAPASAATVEKVEFNEDQPVDHHHHHHHRRHHHRVYAPPPPPPPLPHHHHHHHHHTDQI